MGLTDFQRDKPRGFDLHVLRNSDGPLLVDHLLVAWATPDKVFPASHIPADVTTLSFQFQAHFAGAPNAFGLQVDPHTGRVRALAAPAGVQLRNFVIDVLAHDAGPPIVDKHQQIRIHIHNAIQRIWLAPATLTVHRGARGVRFSVLARFDDGVIGDITGSDFVVWNSRTPANADVDPDTGELDAKIAGTDTVIEARRVGIPPNDPPDATGTVHCAPPWATPVNVNFVAGKGPAQVESVPNILFLSDGFEAGDSDAFEKLVRATIQQLRSSGSTRPYDLLSDSMNYWSAFTPSRQPGISVAPELFTLQLAPGLRGFEIPMPLAPSAPAGQPWTIPELIHQVGLPVPVDDQPPRPLLGAGGKLAAWQTLYGNQITQDRVTYYDQPQPGLGMMWLHFTTRTLVNDRDSAFFITLGERPRLDQVNAFRSPDFYPIRITPKPGDMPDDLNAFLSNLQLQGTTIGARWARNGKDFGRICVLARTNHLGGANSKRGGYITATLKTDGLHILTPAPGGLGFDIQPEPVPTQANVNLTSTVAHEIGHSFGLDDEYGEKGARDPAVLAFPADLEPRLAIRGNVVADSDLRDGISGLIVPGLIKWNWPRLAKVGILAEKPVRDTVPGTFKVKLQPGHASFFRTGDIVRLRGRHLLPLSLGEPAPMPLTSYTLKIESIELGEVVNLTGFAGTPEPPDYPAGSLLVCPALDSNGQPLSLIAPIIATHLLNTQAPLNRPRASPFPACDFDMDDRQPARNLPDGLPRCRPRKKNMIVGIWDGGASFHCGIYHPTGFCAMRAEIDNDKIIGFCTVCRYVMVDFIDPTKHGKLESDYKKLYPQP